MLFSCRRRQFLKCGHRWILKICLELLLQILLKLPILLKWLPGCNDLPLGNVNLSHACTILEMLLPGLSYSNRMLFVGQINLNFLFNVVSYNFGDQLIVNFWIRHLIVVAARIMKGFLADLIHFSRAGTSFCILNGGHFSV
jgi:hypothetical protein